MGGWLAVVKLLVEGATTVNGVVLAHAAAEKRAPWLIQKHASIMAKRAEARRVRDINYGSAGFGGLQVVVSLGESPIARWLEEIRKTLGESWAELAARSGVSADVLKRVRAGHVPLIQTARQMLGIGTDAATADRLLAWVRSRRREWLNRRGNQAQCRVCRRWERACLVRSRRTFKPSQGLKPASFVHRECREQPAKVTLVCPEDGCGKTRRVYWSARRKRAHRRQRRRDGSYAVLCKPHNLAKQGRRQTPRMRKELFRWFQRRFDQSPYARKHTARGIWERAKAGDPEGQRIRADVMAAEARRRYGVVSPIRGARIARGQLLKRWAWVARTSPSKRKGFLLCRLCWLLVHGRKYHTGPGLCWDTWRRTPEFQEERERRRWSKEKSGRQPIDPRIPGFVGRPPQLGKITQKFGWFAQNLAGVAQKQLALEAGVTQPAVAAGIEDFKRWLPGDWGLVFYRKASAAILQERFALPEGIRNHHGQGHEHRVRWLAGWGMDEEAIGRVLGYRVGQVRGVLTRPMRFRESMLVRVVPADDHAKRWRTEVWGASGWEPVELAAGEVLLRGVPASRAALRAFGVHSQSTSAIGGNQEAIGEGPAP